MRRVLRWIKRIVLGTLLLVVVVIATVLILLHTDWGRNKARTIALAQLQQFFPGGIDVERIEGSVLGDIELVGVTINGFDKKRMIHAGKVRANLKLSALFGKTIELEYAEAEDVDVVDPGNPVKIKEDPTPSTWNVAMPRITVRKAHVTITGEQPMTFENVEIDAALSVVADGMVISTKASVRGHWKERGFPLTVEAEAKIAERIELPRLLVTLADTRIEATKIVVDPAQPVATLAIHASPAVVSSFAPKLVLPAAVDGTVGISAAGKETRIELDVAMGTSVIKGAFLGSIAAKSARGILAVNRIDLGAFVPRLTGSGDGVFSFVLDGTKQTAHVLALVRGQVLDLPPGHAMIDLDGDANGARAMLVAGALGDAGVAVVGRITRDGDKLELVHAQVNTTVHDASLATNGQVPFKGRIVVSGQAHGSIAPELDLVLTGRLAGAGLMTTDPKMKNIRIAQVDGRIDGKISAAGTFTHVHALATQVSRQGTQLGTFEVDARNQRDGTIAAHVDAHPAMLPGSLASFDATISLGRTPVDPIIIALGDHTVTVNRATWSGTGGTVEIGATNVFVRDFHSTHDKSSIDANVTIVKATGALEIKVAAQNVALSMIDPAYLGTVSATVDMKRRGIRWDGKANIKGTGVVLAKDQPPIEGTAALTIANRRVKADISATTFEVGGVRLVLDVDGPRDITDPMGWRGLERKAVRTAMLALTRIDLAAAKVKTGGIVDGELVLAGMDTSGTLTVRSVQTPVGMVKGDINFAPMGDMLGVSSTVNVENFGDAQIAAQIAIPAHPFEPKEWKRLGRGVIQLATVTIEDLVIDPAKLARLGIITPYAARANIGLALAAGSGEVRATIDVRDLHGGKLKKPLDVLVQATIDPKDTTATVQTRIGKKAEWADTDKRLVTVDGKLPGFGFDRWVADPKAVKVAPLEGKLAIPDIDVVEAIALFGRVDITSGKLGGTVTFAGTPLAPTADAELVLTKVNVKPRLAGRKLPTLDELRITGKWDGTVADVLVSGKESDGATLSIAARTKPASLVTSTTAKIDIRNFDIAPVAVFLPGPLVAATGKLGAKITATGLSIDRIRGTFSIDKARVPIHPQVGTLRDANVSIKLNEQGLAYTVDAKIGAGSIKLKGSAPKDLSRIKLDGQVDKFSPIGSIQPVVNAKIDGNIFLEQGLLRAEATLSKTSVTLDMAQGVELLASEMPDDLFLNRTTAPPPTPKQARLPRKPWITVDVKIDSTPIFVKHEYFEVRARASSPKGITLSIGRTFGMEGSIGIERGDVDVLGRHYRVEPGPDKITFDGTPDPLLSIRLVHEFPELTLTADLVGRASKKEPPRMSGTPATFTQDELFAFFLGGDPSGAAGSTTRDAASSVGSALLSAKLARQAKKVIPIKIDTLTCTAATSAAGSNCQAGRWITSNWFLAFKQRIEPRPDESPQEIQLQYYFKRNWVIEAAGFRERFGGDVLWRKRW